jgi:hypothetical protein
VIGDLDTYHLLRTRGADPDIRTPVFDVHILHFAAALLQVDLLKAVGIPLSKASTTAICHSLLHIAALPFNWSDFEESAPKVKQSIHDERGMVASFRICEETTKEWDRGGYGYTEGQQHLVNNAEFEAKVTYFCSYGGMTSRECAKSQKGMDQKSSRRCHSPGGCLQVHHPRAGFEPDWVTRQAWQHCVALSGRRKVPEHDSDRLAEGTGKWCIGMARSHKLLGLYTPRAFRRCHFRKEWGEGFAHMMLELACRDWLSWSSSDRHSVHSDAHVADMVHPSREPGPRMYSKLIAFLQARNPFCLGGVV